jgi:uncharacterized protein
MSQQKSEAVAVEGFSEEAIEAYLRRHPDFFERHPALLLGLRVPHRTGGAAVSLVERQVAMLRQRSSQLERQLKDLVAVAKLNDALVEKSHQLALKLMASQGLAQSLVLVETSLREDFLAERAAMVLFADADIPAPAGGFVKVFHREDPALRPFSAFIRGARPRCGIIRDRQKELLFERDAEQLSSAAMVPLGDGGKLGFLVIGSRDPDHFHPTKRLDFLTRLGGLISVALGCARHGRT